MVIKCFHWSFPAWLMPNNIKDLCAAANMTSRDAPCLSPASRITLAWKALFSEKLDDRGAHCSGRPVRRVLLFCLHEQYNQYAVAVLCSWWARLVVSFREGKCTPAWPHPVNTLMHLRTLTSIIISLHFVPEFNKAFSKQKTTSEWTDGLFLESFPPPIKRLTGRGHLCAIKKKWMKLF